MQVHKVLLFSDYITVITNSTSNALFVFFQLRFSAVSKLWINDKILHALVRSLYFSIPGHSVMIKSSDPCVGKCYQATRNSCELIHTGFLGHLLKNALA